MSDKVKENDTQGIRVAVYGTLRKELYNNYLLRDSDFLGSDVIESGFRMVSLGSFPALLEADKKLSKPITVEVYRINKDVLSQLDALEGHPDWYIRRKVPTKFKNAWVYVMPETECRDNSPVDSGDWLDFSTTAEVA